MDRQSFLQSISQNQKIQSRRTFLKRTSTGVGGLALSSMLARSLRGSGVDPHLRIPPKCKRVIHLCMAGGPSHLETLDYKPKLEEMDGKPMPKSVTEGQQIAQLQGQRDKLKIL